MAVFVKICGITNAADAEAAIEAGADALGFNFWAGSPRHVELGDSDWIGKLPDSVQRVAVVVNPTLERVRQILSAVPFEIIQLHGAESPEMCAELASLSVKIWKAIPVTGPDFADGLPRFAAQRLLLDTANEQRFGGTGLSFPWLWAGEFIAANPDREIILAGGLTPANVSKAIRQARPFGVDVSSGVETFPRRKDAQRMRDFVAAARRA